MKRRLIIFISLILVLLTITAVSANNQTTFKHIQTEIDNADEGSTVTITQDIKDSDNIIVNKSISIEGNGVTLDGKDCIFAIQAQNVTVRGINFVNGWCFEVSNSTTIMSCSFKNNSPADNCLLNLNFANSTE